MVMKRLFKAVILISILAAGVMTGCQGTSPPSTPIPEPSSTPILPITSPVPTIQVTRIPIPSPTPLLGCNDIHGKISNIEVVKKGFPKPMEVNVSLPPCYSENYSGGYPVLYLIHGQSFTNDQWIRLGVPETADGYFLSGTLNPFLVVMPRDEYYLEDWNKSTFGENLVNGLVPWIDSHYHTCSQRSCRAIGGLSRGAIWAIVLGLSFPDQFGTIGAHSLPNSPYAEAITRDLFKALGSQGETRLYLDIGDVDGYKSRAEIFNGYLQKYNIPHEWRLNHGGHDEDYWRSHVPDYLLWYGQTWK
jgi:enterochelin esterase-like enzyme